MLVRADRGELEDIPGAAGARQQGDVGDEVFQISHAYPDRVVELHFFACTLTGEPRPMLGQEVRWVTRDELPTLEFPPADEELIRRLSQEPS